MYLTKAGGSFSLLTVEKLRSSEGTEEKRYGDQAGETHFLRSPEPAPTASFSLSPRAVTSGACFGFCMTS